MGNSDSKPVPGEWVWSKSYQDQAKVIEWIELWGTLNCRMWLPNRDDVVLVPASDLQSLSKIKSNESGQDVEKARIRYILMASKLANMLTEDILLAPLDVSVIPLPHQIKVLRKAISRDRIRLLLADEVGLGKTIEAGLIMREMKLRGFVKRVLVVSPKGLVTQWIAEMQTHFGEEFRFYSPADFSSYRRVSQKDNIWQTFDQIICSLDSVKPVDSRKGWSEERLSQFNKDRFIDIVNAGWDMIIVDESHRLGGSSDQVARHQLGKGLAEASPYLLLLSATPHQGKTDAFHRLLTLLDKTAFPDSESIIKERVLPYVIRTEKRHAIDADGKELFKPRLTKMVSIKWKPEHEMQRQLYDAVTEYVREGYNQSLKEKKGYLGFLMILMQRLVTSSTRAISATLARRLEVLYQPQEQLSLFPSILEDEWADLDGQDQLESVLSSRLKALKNEKAEVQLLLDAAKQVEARGSDAKADALLEWIYTLQKEESDSELKVLIFTEFIPTQEMLSEFLTDRGFSVVCLNGSMNMGERKRVQDLFSKEIRILISTDAGGEGLNLQFCHVVINYDIPWNPMRLEQRIGRVDRIGQDKIVRAVNFIIEDTVEFRVREVLEEKLLIILHDFGVDKTSDVLDSAEAGNLFDSLYIEALLHPETLDTEAQRVILNIQKEAEIARNHSDLLKDDLTLLTDDAQQANAFPLADYIETMTSNYIGAYGGAMKRQGDVIELTWPNEKESQSVVFPRKGVLIPPNTELLSLDHPRIRDLLSRLPRYVGGQPIKRIKMTDAPENIHGYWSLWQIRMISVSRQYQKIMPLFLHDDGRNLMPTARFVWDQMNISDWLIYTEIDSEKSLEIFKECERFAIDQGQSIYLEIRQKHINYIKLEQEKKEYSLKARRRLLNNVGLEEVRAYRLRKLKKEENEWKEALKQQKRVMPEMIPLILLRIN